MAEHKFKMDESSANATQKAQVEQMANAMEEMKKQLANLPPEQRKMMEDMMAQQGISLSDKGVDMASQGLQITKDGTTVKACITKEEIDRGELPKISDDCEEKVTQSSPKVIKLSYVCKGDNPMHGEGTIIFQNNKSYTGEVAYTTTIAGSQQTFHAVQSGKWLASDCGEIKPASQK